jgi:hypothetical protein
VPQAQIGFEFQKGCAHLAYESPLEDEWSPLHGKIDNWHGEKQEPAHSRCFSGSDVMDLVFNVTCNLFYRESIRAEMKPPHVSFM